MTYSLKQRSFLADGPAATETLAALGQQGQFSTAEARDKGQNILASPHYTCKDPGRYFQQFHKPLALPLAPIIQPISSQWRNHWRSTLTMRDSSISHFIWFRLAVLTGCILLASGIAITLTRHLHNGLVEALKISPMSYMMCVPTAIFPDEFRKNVSLSFTASLSTSTVCWMKMEEWQLRLQAKNAQLLRTALHDPLTGLANRAAFM